MVIKQTDGIYHTAGNPEWSIPPEWLFNVDVDARHTTDGDQLLQRGRKSFLSSRNIEDLGHIVIQQSPTITFILAT